jgi:hypothetical protein
MPEVQRWAEGRVMNAIMAQMKDHDLIVWEEPEGIPLSADSLLRGTLNVVVYEK